ncbi:MAG: response regulator [Desulfobulbaceae bacterium]|nr:response regulator [Desulfobulbaceae bacterium]
MVPSLHSPGPQTILIFDDDFSNLTLLSMILQDGSFSVLEADHWEKAQNLLEHNKVDLILLDIVLADLDGYQICKKIKNHQKFQDIPVIFITSLDEPFDEEKGFMAGAVDYLRKPIHPDILKARVITHLNIKQQREQLEAQNLELAEKTLAYKQEAQRRRNAEEELMVAYSSLEDRVKERTAELREVNQEMANQIKRRRRSEQALLKSKEALTRQNIRLEELNAALKVLLDKRDKDQKEFEERIVTQVKQLVDPYIRKLQQTKLNESQSVQLDILSTNLDEIVSPFTRNIFALELQLTPVEIQIANLVKQGKSSKEIAELVCITPGTVDLHRKNIRKKFGISNKKVNLRTYLLSFQN